MCGRYVLKRTLQQVAGDYDALLPDTSDWSPNFNAYPSQFLPIVLKRDNKKEIRLHHWGLIPFWAKDKKISNHTKNAKSETIHKLPSYRAAFKKRRCIVPADGFYEWKETPDRKIPYFIYPAEDVIFSFAGLHEHWEQGDVKIDSFTIITTPANETIRQIHDRMPAMLFGQEIDQWLDPGNQNPGELLHPSPNDSLEYYTVSKDVNNVRNQGPQLILPKKDLFS